MSTPNSAARRSGRPKAGESPVAAEDLLDAAFHAFARYGYDGVSVRLLSRELGVSHSLIHQRYGTKHALWQACVDQAFSRQVSELAAAVDPRITDPFEQLEHVIREFLRFSARHPEVFAMMNIEAGLATDRLDYIFDTYIRPALEPLDLLLRLLQPDDPDPVLTLRSVFFLITQGGGAPFALQPLAAKFGDSPLEDEVQVEAQVALSASLIAGGIRAQLAGGADHVPDK